MNHAITEQRKPAKLIEEDETSTTLHDLQTPCLVLDAMRMERNVARLRARVADLGVRLRPHLKTGKSVEVARRVIDMTRDRLPRAGWPRGPEPMAGFRLAGHSRAFRKALVPAVRRRLLPLPGFGALRTFDSLVDGESAPHSTLLTEEAPSVKAVKSSLRDMGVPEAQTSYKFFGPASALA